MPTDKMISRKDGPIGTMIFNNPERHNATSLEMWQAANEILEAVLATSQQSDSITAGGKAAGYGNPKTGPGTDEQEVAAVD